MDGRVELVLAGDERSFRLGIAEALELERLCECGVIEIAERFGGGGIAPRWRLRDVREVLRLGLMGGGAEAKLAKQLVEQAVVPGQLYECAIKARIVLAAALADEDPPDAGKEGDGAPAPVTPQSGSSPPSSTETALSSDSRRQKSDA